MQKWLISVAVCFFSLAGFFVAPATVFADSGSDDKGYTIFKGSVLINDTLPEDMKRHWVYMKCDHWAGCYMRCIGRLNACEYIAETVSWKELYLFSDKSAPYKPKKEVKK